MPLKLDLLRTSDIPAALRLSSGAGWNQVEADWQRLIELWPGTCLAGKVAGELVTTATLAIYGNVGWVGMVLVDPAHQKKGFGSTMLDEIIRLGDRAGLKTLGLDATDQGKPIYLKKGFVDQVGIDRWKAMTPIIPQAHREQTIDWNSILTLDKAITGFDRGALIKKMSCESGAITRCVGSPARAYALARPGRKAFHIGPVVSESAELIPALLDAILSDPGKPVIIDVPRGGLLEPHLKSRGFEISRRLTRMLRPSAAAHRENYAAVCGFDSGNFNP